MANLNDGLFWAAREINGKVEFFRSTTYTKNAEIYQDLHIPQKFLRVENNEVIVLSKYEQNLIMEQELYNAEQEQIRLEQERINNEILQQQQELEHQQYLDSLPFDISKLQVCLKLKELNKLEDFMAYINSDEEIKFLWNAASVLTSNNELLLFYLSQPEVLAILPSNQLEFLKTCKI
jgi:hypothetical protein